ncbi:dipeptidase [Marinicrinis lubricantis]|uniref:Dipeptidase n=1 Tax=Marinicrinis lubricantis TaxID=2086470 RepID=A0ABW1IMA2_9BACL
MKVFDLHCDVLTKLYSDTTIHFQDGKRLDVTYDRMKGADNYIQCFAIYLPERISRPDVRHWLHYIQVFHEKILSFPDLVQIRSKTDLIHCVHHGKLGAILTIEGMDALGGQLELVRAFYELGVRCAGITWNYGNWAADGILEPRGGGLTRKGKQFVELCNELGIVIDVSHLSVKGFWDVCEVSDQPFIASHSNVKSVCGHPRNLSDDQIKEIIRRNGRIGLNFVPFFISRKQASMHDLLHHIDYICALGGSRVIGFGSDFDGIEEWTYGLEHAGKYQDWAELLTHHYGSSLAEQWLWRSMYDFFLQHLPDE